jgi:hypothetical protein
MRRFLSLALAAVVCLPVVGPRRADAALSLATLRGYVSRVGAKIESARGNILVTTMAAGRTRVEIRLLNDNEKNRLGMYAYGFGNVASVGDKAELFGYLLRANSELGVGSFFVDKDDDVGYKALLDTRDPLSFETFQISYLAMVNAIKEHRGEIARLAGPGGQGESPSTDVGEGEGAAR